MDTLTDTPSGRKRAWSGGIFGLTTLLAVLFRRLFLVSRRACPQARPAADMQHAMARRILSANCERRAALAPGSHLRTRDTVNPCTGRESTVC
jgi:hypothetical protein